MMRIPVIASLIFSSIAMNVAIALPAQQRDMALHRLAANTSVQQGTTRTGSVHRVVPMVSLSGKGMTIKNALLELARRTGKQLSVNDVAVDLSRTIDIELVKVPLDDALTAVLKTTSAKAVMTSDGETIVIVPATQKAVPAKPAQDSGVITGIIIDATTKRPIGDAMIRLDEDGQSVRTDSRGAFRFAPVSPGSHRLRVRVLGYLQTTRTVTVGSGARITVEIGLEPQANTLDQVIVTGTVVATAQKEIPNAITVITARDIEQRGITQIEQLFRGDVPGLFAMNQGSGAVVDQVSMFSRGSTSLISLSNESPTPIKTYVDGVELADARYLSSIDPKSIERIEIVPGPQASTIYGSNAINGVMQIFTKRGTSTRPQITASLMSGTIQNNFSSSVTPQHDYSAQISGAEGRVSYNAGGGWAYVGPWTPAKQVTTISGFGGVRLQGAKMHGDFSVRRTQRISRTRGYSSSQIENERRNNGDYVVASYPLVDSPERHTLLGQTIGLTVGYSPFSWWSHEVGVGNDISQYDLLQSTPRYLSPNDTILQVNRTETNRTSLRYTTTAAGALTSIMRGTVTLGADQWRSIHNNLMVRGGSVEGTLTGPIPSFVQRIPDHNTGAFAQGQLGLWDALFFTYGVRLEWNPNYGDEASPNVSPRYGVAYTHEMGMLTAKLRFSYGKSTRPPTTDQKGEIVYESPAYGGRYYGRYPSPELGPEFQQGGEGGIELYFGNRGSLVVTRYNQTVDGLIGQPYIDSVMPVLPGFPVRSISQSLNIGSIRNQGWELQGSVTTGPLTTRGTYSWTKSRVIGLTEAYRELGQGLAGTYTPGASFGGVPEHTWAIGFTYARGRTTAALNINGTGQLYRWSDDFWTSIFNARLSSDKLRMTAPSPYQAIGSAYATADLNTSTRVNAHVDGVLQVQNLTDVYRDDYGNGYATMGRQVNMGVRLRF